MVPVTLGERAEFDRIIDDERGLDEVRLDERAEDLVDDLAGAHRIIDLETQGAGHREEPWAIESRQVVARGLLDRFQERNAPPRTSEREGSATEGDHVGAVEGNRHLFDHFFDELHHPPVFPVGDVQLEHGELGVVEPTQALVSEVLRDLVDPFEPADDQALEVQLVGNPQEEVDIQRIVMGRERARCRPSVQRLQNRRLDLDVTPIIQETPDRGHQPGPLTKDLAHLRVDDEVHVPLAVPEFLVGHLVEDPSVGLLDHGKGAQSLGEQFQAFGVDRQLAHLRAERVALHAHDVADIEQALENVVVESFGQIVPSHVDLDLAGRILQIEEGGLSHDALRQDAAGERDPQGLRRRRVVGRLVPRIVEGRQYISRAMRNVPRIGVRVDAGRFECRALLAPPQFLFASNTRHGSYRR